MTRHGHSSAATRPAVVLAAGGTGGHLFPAQALAEVLHERGYVVHLMTDRRGLDHSARFPAFMVHVIPSATIVTSKPLTVPGQLLRLGQGFLKARSALGKIAPVAVVGFGGYPSLPPLVAALSLRLPVLLHEQNALMGKANRFIAPHATAIATAFPEVALVPEAARDRVTLVGNPVRAAVLAASDRPYQAPEADGEFNLLVFGGSQGARIFSDIVPPALAELPVATRRALRVVQQAREEDIARVQQGYAEAGIAVEVKPFFTDMAERIARAHLVICRAGASTVSELGVIGRPAILVPLAQSLEGDQMNNARQFVAAGGGWLMEQSQFTPERLTNLLLNLRYDDRGLERAAEGARQFGRPDAAIRLADLLQAVAPASGTKSFDPTSPIAASTAAGTAYKEP